MKRLAKILALFLLVVVVVAAVHAIRTVLAAQPPFKFGTVQVICQVNKKIPGQTCPVSDANSDGDINIKQRGFAQLSSQLGDDRLRLVNTCVQAVNIDPKAPNLCGLFSDNRVPAFNSIFAVGKRDVSGDPKPSEPVPPHLVGMQTKQGEPIRVPNSGYGIGGGYQAMIIYADLDSVTLKYTTYDDLRDPGIIDPTAKGGGGYEIHIIGFAVDPALVTEYNYYNRQQGNVPPRTYLPALKAGDQMGTANRTDVLVSIRDSGEFFDPRWKEDWWKSCSGPSYTAATVNHVKTPYEPNLQNIDSSTIRTSQSSGSEGCPKPGETPGGPNNPVVGSNLGTSFPPIHTLQVCPPEVPTIGSLRNTDDSSAKSVAGCPAPLVDEPDPCKDPELAWKAARTEGFCAGINQPIRKSIAWCDLKSCGALIAASKKFVEEGKGPICYSALKDKDSTAQGCGHYTGGFCDGTTDDPKQKFHLSDMLKTCHREDGKQDFNSDEIKMIGRCQSHYIADGSKPNQNPTVNENAQGLPACVPTYNAKANCVTECSPPVAVNETYRLFLGPIQNCINTQDCVLKMQLDNPTISLPFTKDLANYFGGSLDAGGVANGSISQDQLDNIKNAIAGGNVTQSTNFDLIQQGFNNAGVAKKLLPEETQNQLKCQFIKYVKDKISSRQNTKYKFYTDDTKTKTDVFKIDNVPVTSVEIPPYLDPISCTRTTYDKSAVDDWNLTVSGKSWIDVPLFPDDDTQGEVQFASPTLYSSKDTSQTPPIGPVYISVPDVQRLSSAVDVLQKALIPQAAITTQQQQIAAKQYPEAIGKTLQIIKTTDRVAAGLEINACRPIPQGEDAWTSPPPTPANPTGAPIYSKTLVKSYESALSNPSNTESEFDRGVLCKVPIKTDDGSNSSKICVVGPTGQLFCYREDTAANANGAAGSELVQDKQVLQVRTVIPYLFDLAENAISPATGLLRIFKPKYITDQTNIGANPTAAADYFESQFDPLPAASSPVKYQLTGGNATIDESSPLNKDETGQPGWKIFFYKLGGVWNARNFVLDLLNPPSQH